MTRRRAITYLITLAALVGACNWPAPKGSDQIPNQAEANGVGPDLANRIEPRQPPDAPVFAFWKPCPRLVEGQITPPLSAKNPVYFKFGGTIDSKFRCEQSGPVRWPADSTSSKDDWYIQKIEDLIPDKPECWNAGTKQVSCRSRLVRICSNSAAHLYKTDFYPGPCATQKGAGLAGCEVCMAQDYKAD